MEMDASLRGGTRPILREDQKIVDTETGIVERAGGINARTIRCAAAALPLGGTSIMKMRVVPDTA